jgi:hypothetical protein
MIFAKPDVVIVLDQVDLTYRPQPLEIRFFPDNRDHAAILRVSDDRSFVIERPKAKLNAVVASLSGTELSTAQLDLPEESGTYPFVSVGSGESLKHEIVTLMSVSPIDRHGPGLAIRRNEDGWGFEAGELSGSIDTSQSNPWLSVF